MGGFAVWTIFWKHKFIALLASHNYAFAAYGLFLAGALAIIGGVFGWCGVWRENRAILLCVSKLMIHNYNNQPKLVPFLANSNVRHRFLYAYRFSTCSY